MIQRMDCWKATNVFNVFRPQKILVFLNTNSGGLSERFTSIIKWESLILVVFFTFHADIHNLEDVVVGTQLQIAYVDLGVITKEILC